MGWYRNRTAKTTLFDSVHVVNLQEWYSHKPGETETEYLQRLSLTGGHNILLNSNEANNFWGM